LIEFGQTDCKKNYALTTRFACPPSRALSRGRQA